MTFVSGDGKSEEAYRMTDKGLVAVSFGSAPEKGTQP
jgi:hypothetical protein